MNLIRKYYIQNGQFFITTTPVLISTVLGSCVSVCLWDKRTHIGGMNHYLLPGTEEDKAGNADRGFPAVKMLIRSLLNRGVDKADLEAKIFGGCNSLYQKNDLYEIGKRNIDVARQILKENDIAIVASDTGGQFGRKIIFNTGTGKVKMRLLNRTAADINEEINKGFNY
ncbi:chemotaxis protein CheD [Chryseolinea lacunae]|uniref:Probable chemoreceptor glutamine deamidase CheD n=1 Tax=Chryseolinea lacunae TaxID=2801331 RepID=A0ABS1L208_9BACT|nr:chemotaxis protein CheD [Chryseolinea lacunae]MBL0744561.1 chemotaxis protein CheD [Chryseolinea lacunae]